MIISYILFLITHKSCIAMPDISSAVMVKNRSSAANKIYSWYNYTYISIKSQSSCLRYVINKLQF